MHELAGTDYYWYCSDAAGRIAVMLTAGMAPIPTSVLRRISENNSLRQYLLKLPAIGSYSIKIRDVFVKNASGVYSLTHIAENPIPDDQVAKDLYGDFFGHASQGIYGYDWPDIHRIKKWESGKYELIASPTIPLMASDLPSHLQDVISATTLRDIRFAENDSIDVGASLECE